jgi:hypothetical protein
LNTTPTPLCKLQSNHFIQLNYSIQQSLDVMQHHHPICILLCNRRDGICLLAIFASFSSSLQWWSMS